MERPLTQDIKSDGQPLTIDEYERTGGYQALQKALWDMNPGQVQE